MPQQHILKGLISGDEVNGETDRSRWDKAQDNFDELYSFISTHASDIWERIGTTVKYKTAGDTLQLGSDTNNITFNADGTITLNGTATVFDDKTYDPINLKQAGPGISINLVESSVDYLTTANDADYMLANIQLSHKKKFATAIYAHLHFWQDRNSVPNFALQYRYQISGGTKTTAWTAVKCNIAAHTYPGAGTINQIAHTASGIIPPALERLSDIIQFRIIRDTANGLGLLYGADPFGAVASVLSFDVHCEYDTLGSSSEFSK